MHEEYHYAYRYDELIPPEQVLYIRHRCLDRLLLGKLAGHLLGNLDKTFTVRLTELKDTTGAPWRDRYAWAEIHLKLEVNEVATMYVTEYVDYRPFGWWALSQTAMEEIGRRLTWWWRRSLSHRRRIWLGRLARFEREHFGRSFDGRKQKSGAFIST